MNAKVTFSGPGGDPAVSADIEIFEVHTVMGALGDFPATAIIGGAAADAGAEE